jgi:glycogen synthase
VSEPLSFSVVINTDGRIDYLKKTLDSLQYLRYSNFEVCVVSGPTADGTRQFLADCDYNVKVAHCARRNLSESRNIGIAMASGDVVAFIDDDAIPEAEWLADLAPSYDDPAVGAVGGFVYNHTGVEFQARYVTTDRRAYAKEWSDPSPNLNFPLSVEYPHLLGTNCSFRRSALLEIGGFDEEFEYFLDETDVCCRMNDAAHRIVQLPNAFVHHKYAPSELRDHKRIVKTWYPLIKNRVYFAMRNGRFHHSFREILSAGMQDAADWEVSIRGGVKDGIYLEQDLDRFLVQADAAIKDGLDRGSQAKRKLLRVETQRRFASPFRPYRLRLPLEERRVICLVTQDYPPGQNGGIARNVSSLARALADAGHQIHVLTMARGPATVDFEDRVWVHRLNTKDHSKHVPSPIAPMDVPPHIWNRSKTMLDEVKAIHERRSVDVVYCPLWDCEPLAFVMDGTFPLICGLQTTMKFWLDSQPMRAADPEWMRELGNPIIAAEEYILRRATVVQANSRAIVRDIERKYDLTLCRDRVVDLPHGMEDWAHSSLSEPSNAASRDVLRLLFVGRLESRKGIDLLLSVAPDVLRRFPNVVLDIVGDDTIVRPDGKTYKSEFLNSGIEQEILDRIAFHGRVEEEELRGFYRRCDVFVAPSRYESFGLVFVEAMIFGKPVIGCDAGGMPEVVTHGRTGLLAQPGDRESLRDALDTLLRDEPLRQSLGAAARADYERRFTEAVMRDEFLNIVTSITAKHPRETSGLALAAKGRAADRFVGAALGSPGVRAE